MDLGLRGKIALVTGGSHGIGLSTALALASEGCRVAVCARNPGRLQEAAAALRDLGVEALGIQADVLVEADIDRVMATLTETWGTLHILVNNAGGGGRWGTEDPETTPESTWAEVYGKNALATTRFTLRALPLMRRQGWGRVVTVTSVLGLEGGGRPWFNMAKVAQTTLMKNFALRPDYARAGITFNSVAPGCIMIPDTGWDLQRREDPEAFEKMVQESFPMGRLGAPEDVADLIVFLCSERARHVNGASIPVDGAESRRL